MNQVPTKGGTPWDPRFAQEAVTSVRLRPLCRQMRVAVDSNEGGAVEVEVLETAWAANPRVTIAITIV